MAKQQVSLDSFKKFIIDTKNEKIVDFLFRTFNKQGGQAPVTSISWQTAQDFIHWMNQNKPKNDKGVYRLPTEAEWEYVARGNRKSLYNFFYYALLCCLQHHQVKWQIYNLGKKKKKLKNLTV